MPYCGKKASSFAFRECSPRSKQQAEEGLRVRHNRLPKNKHNPLCTDTCGRYRALGSSIRRDFPREGAGDGGQNGRKKEYSEEKIDRFVDLVNLSPGICKAATRHIIDPRFVGLCLPLSFFLFKNSPSLSRHFRYCVGGQVGTLLAVIFAAAETAISAPAKLNCCSRGGKRMAARGPVNVATELREGDNDKKRRETYCPTVEIPPVAKSRCHPR